MNRQQLSKRSVLLAAAAVLALLARPAVTAVLPQAAPASRVVTAGQVWLEFTVGGAAAADAFLVGYFADEKSRRPILTYRVPASDVQRGDNGAVRLSLHGWREAESDVVVRIRTVSQDAQSGWSDPGGRLTAVELASLQPAETGHIRVPGSPGKGAAPDTGRRANARAAAHAEATAAAFKGNAALRDALGKRYPGVDLDAGIAGYERLQDFVAALEASQRHGIEFSRLKPGTTGRQMKLADALLRLKPEIDAKAAAREASSAARKLIRSARNESKK